MTTTETKVYGRDAMLGGECVVKMVRNGREYIARRRNTSPTDGALWYIDGIDRGYRHLRDLSAKLTAMVHKGWTGPAAPEPDYGDEHAWNCDCFVCRDRDEADCDY